MEGEEFEGKSQTAQKVYDSIIGEHWRVTIYLNVVGRHAPAGSADISSHVDVISGNSKKLVKQSSSHTLNI